MPQFTHFLRIHHLNVITFEIETLFNVGSVAHFLLVASSLSLMAAPQSMNSSSFISGSALLLL
jgi:hypothetical protein